MDEDREKRWRYLELAAKSVDITCHHEALVAIFTAQVFQQYVEEGKFDPGCDGAGVVEFMEFEQAIQGCVDRVRERIAAEEEADEAGLSH
jgi:hypothetical protein